MSHIATNWAFSQKDLKPAEKLLLLCLADRHNPDAGCFPSQERLAADAGMSRASVNDNLSRLETRGLIRREQRQNERTKRQQSTRYILGFEEEFTQEPCPESVHGAAETDQEHLPEPCPESVHGPCPDFGESRVQILDTNLVRLTLDDEERVRANLLSEFVKEIVAAVGHPELIDRPFWKLEAEKGAFVEAWRGKGLSDAAILDAARLHAADMPEPPNGPKGLDRAMARKARGDAPAAASSSGAGLPVDPQAVLKGKAARIKAGRDFFCRDITHSQAIELVAAGLVTAAECRTVGVRVLDDDPGIEAARTHLASVSAPGIVSTDRATLARRVDFWRVCIKEGRPVSSNALSADVRRALVRQGHVTEVELRRRGL